MDNNYSPEILSIAQCSEVGITFPSVRMPNGEYRFRCMEEDANFGYILTKMPDNQSGWQNGHYHKKVYETYIIQSGWIGYASLVDGKLQLKLYNEDDIFTTQPMIPHNIYMSAGAIVHTVKHGQLLESKDWFASPELDDLTKNLSEDYILR